VSIAASLALPAILMIIKETPRKIPLWGKNHVSGTASLLVI
jgi:hypothetical protein